MSNDDLSVTNVQLLICRLVAVDAMSAHWQLVEPIVVYSDASYLLF